MLSPLSRLRNSSSPVPPADAGGYMLAPLRGSLNLQPATPDTEPSIIHVLAANSPETARDRLPVAGDESAGGGADSEGVRYRRAEGVGPAAGFGDGGHPAAAGVGRGGRDSR